MTRSDNLYLIQTVMPQNIFHETNLTFSIILHFDYKCESFLIMSFFKSTQHECIRIYCISAHILRVFRSIQRSIKLMFVSLN